MATSAQFTAQPILETFTAGITADTSRSNPSTASTLLCAGPAVAAANGVGKRINRVIVEEVNAIGAGTANVVRFWLSTDGGTTKRLYVEKAITSVTSSSTAIGYRTEVPELVGLVLPGAASNAPSIYFSTHAAVTYHVTVESGLL
jgi:hypothetical protein